MKHMTKYFFTLIILAGTLSTQAQTRTWAFSKDTVYEWAPLHDSVWVTNSGVDTLRFDSMRLELVRPTAASRWQASFYNELREYFFNLGAPVSANDPQALVIPVGKPARLYNFFVESGINGLAKAQDIAPGDTLVMRLIFLASAGRGRDTLMVKGKEDRSTALRQRQDLSKQPVFDGRLFDLRGRRVENIPEGARVPRTPLVSPKE